MRERNDSMLGNLQSAARFFRKAQRILQIATTRDARFSKKQDVFECYPASAHLFAAGIDLAFREDRTMEVTMDAALALSVSPEEDGRPLSSALEYALTVVEAVSETGLTTVPVKPSVAMLTAGARAGQVSVETAWRIYQAMIHEEG
jgi:hypothetical protein